MTQEPSEGAPPTAPPAGQRPPLTRSRHDRVFTGLAGGLASHFGVDPVLVRLALVLLTIFSSGVGLVLYIAGSVIVPLEPATAGDASVPDDRSDLGSAAAMVFGILLIGAGAVALLSTAGDIDVDWVAAACAGLIATGAALVVTGGRFAKGPLTALGIALAIALTPLTALHITTDGEAFGDRTVRPASVIELEERYEHAFGSMTIDLRRIELPDGVTTVRANTSFGSLQIFVPRDAGVQVEAEASFGSVQAFGDEANAGPVNARRTFRTENYDSATKRLHIEVESAFGSVEVVR